VFPVHHAKCKFDGSGPQSSRFREILISVKNPKFGPKLLAFGFFVFDFFNHLKVFSRPLDEEEKIIMKKKGVPDHLMVAWHH
jgi:hypothetical protein